MNKLFFIISVGLTVSLLSCGQSGKKDEKVNERTYQLSENSSSGEFAMQSSSAKGDVKINGAEFHYQIERVASSQLPKVKDEQGNIFIDNVIDLNITRNGKVILSKRFTKKEFASQVEATFLSKSILEGLVFDKVIDGKLRFAASVCYPQTDLFVPLCVLVDTDGRVRIEKGSVLEDEIPGGSY
jgi:hypothetical protein